MYSSSSKSDAGQNLKGLSPSETFCVLTGILALVGSINHGGVKRLSLPGGDTAGYDRLGRFRYKYSRSAGSTSSARRALNALAALLVRNGEIVACTVPELTTDKLKIFALTTDEAEEEMEEAEKLAGPILLGLPLESNTSKNEDLTETKEPEHTPIATTSSDNGRPVQLGDLYLAFANPRDKDNYFKNTPKLDVQYLMPENNHWEELLGDRWKVLQGLADTDPLANHISTLESYLGAFKNQTYSKRTSYFKIFICYIIYTCKFKLHRRMRHPLSKALKDTLIRIDDADLGGMRQSLHDETYVIKDEKLRVNAYDFSLSSALVKLSELIERKKDAGADAEDVILAQSFMAMEPIPKLINALRNAVVGQLQTIHHEATYIDFHHLLVAVINGYERALAMIVKLGAKSLETDIEATTKQVQLNGYLLWQISHSSIFSEHLQFLERAGAIRLDQVSERAEMERNKRLAQKEHMEESTKAEGIEAEGIEAEGIEDEEELSVEADSVSDLYIRWTRLLIDHFSSLDYLSKYTKLSKTPPVSIQLLTVRATSTALTASWKTVLEYAMVDQKQGRNMSAIYERIISDYIETKIIEKEEEIEQDKKEKEEKKKKKEEEKEKEKEEKEKARKEKGEEGRRERKKEKEKEEMKEEMKEEKGEGEEEKEEEKTKYWVGACGFDDNEVVVRKSPVHCEAALAAIMKYCKYAQVPVGLTWEDQAWYNIGVSKLCCPVCNELLLYFEPHNQGGPFNVRGFHSIVASTELPSWLPTEVLDHMITRFSKLLVHELEVLYLNMEAARINASLAQIQERQTKLKEFQMKHKEGQTKPPGSEEAVEEWPKSTRSHRSTPSNASVVSTLSVAAMSDVSSDSSNISEWAPDPTEKTLDFVGDASARGT